MAKFSLKGLHTKLEETVERLENKPKSSKRDQLIRLVKGLRADTECPQTMIIDI